MLLEGERRYQRILAGKVIEESDLADAQPLDYVAHAGLLVTALAEQRRARIQNRAALLGFLLLA